MGYTRAAIRANSTYQNCKWVLSQVLAGGTGVTPPTEWSGTPMKVFNRQLSSTKSMAAICEMLGECPYDAASFPSQAHTTAYYRTHGPFAGDSQPDTKRDAEVSASGQRAGQEEDESENPSAKKRK